MKINNQFIPLASFGNTCVASCRKLAAQMSRVKEKLLTEFKGTFQAQEHLLRLALNEAEALAWETDFPQLVFADLAVEKAQAVVSWQRRQAQLR